MDGHLCYIFNGSASKPKQVDGEILSTTPNYDDITSNQTILFYEHINFRTNFILIWVYTVNLHVELHINANLAACIYI